MTIKPALSISSRRRWLAMAILLASSFMNLVDTSIVNVALPEMERSLGVPEGDMEWAVVGYILAFALCLLPMGRLGDIAGHRRMFLWGISVFTLASAFCGLAPNLAGLVIARLLQGLGGAMMVPQVAAIARLMFHADERGRAFALISLSAGLASVAGPVLGGLLIEADIAGWGWRPIFLINVPIGIVAFLLGVRHIPVLPRHGNAGNDTLGVVFATLAMLALIYPLIEGHSQGWPWWTLALLATSPALFGVLYGWLKRQASLDRPQLLPVLLLHDRDYLLSASMSLLYFTTVTGFFVVIASYFQIGFGLTPLQSGLYTIPYPIGVILAAALSGRIGARGLRMRVATGMAFSLSSMILLWLVVGTTMNGIEPLGFIVPLAAGGLGLGFTVSPLLQIALSSVRNQDAGAGSGALQALQQAGSALGVAVIALVFYSLVQGAERMGEPAAAAYGAGLTGVLLYNSCCYLVIAALIGFVRPPLRGLSAQIG